MSTDQPRPRADQSRPVPPAGSDQSDHGAWRSASRRLVTARQLARLLVDAWPVVVRGYLPDLADQVRKESIPVITIRIGNKTHKGVRKARY
jgi:hypothetical protein